MRRRWIKITNTITNNTPATILTIVVLSIVAKPSSTKILHALPKHCEDKEDTSGASSGLTPFRLRSFAGSDSGSRSHQAAPLGAVHDPVLAHPGATTLNKNYQYDYEKQAGNYPDDRGAVHFDSSFLRQFDKKLFELFHHRDHRRSQYHQEQSGKDEKHQWEYPV